MNISHLERIITNPPNPVRPPEDIFGEEPEHGWCYYYQKADLARQLNDWPRVVTLYEEAEEKELRSKFGFEYVPFIEAYAQVGNWQSAFDLSKEAGELTVSMRPLMCSVWSLLADETPASAPKTEWSARLKTHYNCP